MGYGGWSIFFAPRIVDGILSLAVGFAGNSAPFECYKTYGDYPVPYRGTHRILRMGD